MSDKNNVDDVILKLMWLLILSSKHVFVSLNISLYLKGMGVMYTRINRL